MNTINTIDRLLCAALLAAALQAQLPPEIQLDSHMLAAREAAEREDWRTALYALRSAEDLHFVHDLELPPDFHLVSALVDLSRKGYDEALEHVTEYLKLVGRDGTRYEDALRVLHQAEQGAKLARAQAEAEAALAPFRPLCKDKRIFSQCWFELDSPPGCRMWTGRWRTVAGTGIRSWSGECPDGKAHGTGTLRMKSRSEDLLDEEAEGRLEAGKPEGPWVLRGIKDDGSPSESWQKGPTKDGERHGVWIWDMGGGRVIEETYVHGIKHGRRIDRYRHGSTRVTMWEHGEIVE